MAEISNAKHIIKQMTPCILKLKTYLIWLNKCSKGGNSNTNIQTCWTQKEHHGSWVSSKN